MDSVPLGDTHFECYLQEESILGEVKGVRCASREGILPTHYNVSTTGDERPAVPLQVEILVKARTTNYSAR